MSTCVFYVDEAGSTHGYSIPIHSDRSETAVFSLFAVALPLADWRDYDRAYLRLKRKFFRKEIAESSRRAEQWEAKGNDLCSPRNRTSERRHAFLRKVFDICEQYNATAFGVTFLKDPINPMSAEARYCMGLQYLAERFNYFLVESETYNNGILIADRRMEQLDYNVAESYSSFLFGNETGMELTRLVESPLFADSKLTAGLQIADNLASAFWTNQYHYHCRHIPGAPDYSHVQGRYWARLQALEFKSKQRYSGFRQYGYRLCNHLPDEMRIQQGNLPFMDNAQS